MRVSRHLSRLSARPDVAAVQRGRRLIQLTGATACLVALFISAGAHWVALQSFAYTRMLVEFAQEDSLCTAVKKTFDDRYACPLCPKIRDGCNQERKVPQTLNGDRLPEFLLESGEFIFLTRTVAANVPFVSSGYIQFSNTPPKPPPRAA
jgi:hypothetical protein